jgi:hypothetical protein
LELLGLIEDFRQRLLPLSVPLTLLKHHLNRYPVPDWVLVPSAAWVHQQLYPNPHPKELMLRNHVQAGMHNFGLAVGHVGRLTGITPWGIISRPQSCG